GAEGTGHDGAGDVELEIDEKAAEDHEENSDVGIRELAEQALAERRGGGEDCRSVEVQGLGAAVEAMDLAIVERGEERGVVEGEEVDQFQLEGFLVAVRLGVADGILCGLYVASAAAGVGAEEGCGVVFDLLFEDGID